MTSIVPIPQSDSSSTPYTRRHSVVTPRGNISCSYVLHATNAYASHLLPHLAGPDGIVPTRGQIIATRASVTEDILTKTGGVANDGFEYWFPRPLKEPYEKYPLVIIGGGREVDKSKARFELYQTDDSVVDVDVGKALRAFLPTIYPGRFEVGKEPEMEWTGIMGFTKSGDPFVRLGFPLSHSRYLLLTLRCIRLVLLSILRILIVLFTAGSTSPPDTVVTECLGLMLGP